MNLCEGCSKASVCKYKEILTANKKLIQSLEVEFKDLKKGINISCLDLSIKCSERTEALSAQKIQTVEIPYVPNISNIPPAISGTYV